MSIQLRSNVFITISEVPAVAQKKVAGFIEFVSDAEALWYVESNGQRFKDYRKKNNSARTAKESLMSALKSLCGNNIRTKFTIYSMPL